MIFGRSFRLLDAGMWEGGSSSMDPYLILLILLNSHQSSGRTPHGERYYQAATKDVSF